MAPAARGKAGKAGRGRPGLRNGRTVGSTRGGRGGRTVGSTRDPSYRASVRNNQAFRILPSYFGQQMGEYKIKHIDLLFLQL